MVSTLTQGVFATVYKDDYRDSDNYHRILFNSRKHLQARELTQMQTIIQNEIARFGRNIFKEGAAVNPGGPTLNDRYEFIKLNTSTYALPTNPSSLVGTYFTGASSNLKMEVLEVVPAENGDPATIYVKYLGDATLGSSAALRATPSETMSNGTVTLRVQTTNTTVNPAVGRGVKFSSGAGDFFAQGHFVFVQSQSVILSKYSDQYSGVVGFTVREEIVTAADNPALFDNQGTTPNTTAPGADRYRIRLNLIDQNNVDSDQKFVFFAKILNSKIVQNATGADDYNKINDLLALRTKEESGDYIVRQFKLKFDEDSDTNYLIADISPGTAYVNGYRASTSVPTTLRVAKPTSTSTVNNEVVAAAYGNYVIASAIKGVPNVNVLEKWNLYDATGATGSIIGDARIRHVEEDGANYNYYLFDIQMTGNNSFRSVKSVGADTNNYANLILEASEAVIKDAANNDLLFPLPQSRPYSLTDISLQVQKRFSVSTDGSGNASLGSGLLSGGETWSNTNDWVIVNNANGNNLSGTATVTGAGTTTATITGTAVLSGTLEVLAYINKSSATARAKTLTETSILGAVESDGNGLRFVNLRYADIFSVSKIRLDDSNGADLSSIFKVDNGQRDNYYDRGRLVLRFGRSIPGGSVYAKFKYFAHGAGDFFSINSYSIPYKDIPSHVLAAGDTVALRDVLDFRSRIDSSGSSYSGATAKVNNLPVPTDLIQFDATYYLPRYDKLVVDENGTLSFIEGAASFAPKFPITPANTMELYQVRLGANTINDTDLATSAIDHKRFTMTDIARLEKRIDKLEEFTTLSLLEVDTETISVFDSAGLSRTKAGFLADNFSDHFYSDTSATDYRASVDPKQKTLRPTVITKNIRLMYDSDLSSNTILKGDNVYLKYTDEVAVTQDYVSGSENVNPFAVSFNVGIVELSPSSDEWKETKYLPARAVDGGIRLDADEARLFNSWQWNWQGLAASSDDLTGTILGSETNTTTSTSRTRGFFGLFRRRRRVTTTATTVDRVVSDETIREVIDDRIVDVALIPFMRSRRIYFKASGLIPFQRYWPFFDNVSVSSWVKQEPFTRFAQLSADYGDRYRSATAHPFGSTTTITTDANGVIEGSFFIPSGLAGSATPRFRTGAREFKFLNVASGNNIDATSGAIGVFTSQGVLETRQQTIQTTRAITVRSETTSTSRRRKKIDPLAQSFNVPFEEGMFVTKVRVYFKSKPGVSENQAPVALEIRPLVNGIPSSDTAIPGTTLIKTPSEINIPSADTKTAILEAGTDFVFDEPVYLQGNTEYAIVLLSDSNAYRAYVAESGAYEIGTTERRIGAQPSLGSLFLSQNGTTWTPDQTRDMMFRIYKANFSTDGGYATLENMDVPYTALPTNPLTIDNGSRWVTVFHPNHGFDSGDAVKIYGLDSADQYGGIRGSSIMGSNTVSFPDATGYTIYVDSAASSSVFAGGDGVIAQQNMLFDIVNPHIDTLIVNNTNATFEGKFTTGRSLAGGETRYYKSPNYLSLAVKEDNYTTDPLMIANLDAEVSEMAGARSATIKVSLTTSSANVSPVIDLQRSSLILANNIIDRQSSDRGLTSPASRAGGSYYNTPLIYVDETDPDDGSHVAKHITVPVTLAETAVGLKVILGANRPSVAELVVYYRTATGGQNIRDLNWVLLDPEAPIPSDENPDVYREYRYLAGGLGGQLSPFTQYQLKIVFKSSSSSKVPTIKDLRVIAMAD